MKHWLGRNWGLKIISLVLAIGTWYYAVGEENIEVVRVIPIKIQMSSIFLLKSGPNRKHRTSPRAILVISELMGSSRTYLMRSASRKLSRSWFAEVSSVEVCIIL